MTKSNMVRKIGANVSRGTFTAGGVKKQECLIMELK